ncbi:MAG: phosphoribosylformylglycinamidine synthase subunit PurQ, partial [Myxococcales bacterium]|nr:phosphoribosylformylglycinamidine synthase subunit PurQ [Myxococcales bacterium]
MTEHALALEARQWQQGPWQQIPGAVPGAEGILALVLAGYGLNCEAETAAAFALLGASVEQLHVSELLDDPARLKACSILAFMGGFSFGAHVASGRVFANRLCFRLGDALARFVDDG